MIISDRDRIIITTTRYKPARDFIIIRVFINKRDIFTKIFYKDFRNYVFVNDLISEDLNKRDFNKDTSC